MSSFAVSWLHAPPFRGKSSREESLPRGSATVTVLVSCVLGAASTAHWVNCCFMALACLFTLLSICLPAHGLWFVLASAVTVVWTTLVVFAKCEISMGNSGIVLSSWTGLRRTIVSFDALDSIRYDADGNTCVCLRSGARLVWHAERWASLRIGRSRVGRPRWTRQLAECEFVPVQHHVSAHSFADWAVVLERSGVRVYREGWMSQDVLRRLFQGKPVSWVAAAASRTPLDASCGERILRVVRGRPDQALAFLCALGEDAPAVVWFLVELARNQQYLRNHWGVGADRGRINLRQHLDARVRQAVDRPYVLDRHEETVREWVRELRAIATPSRTRYRVAAAPPDTLWRVVESPDEPAPRRVAAAVALRPVLDAEGKARVADVIDTCASDALRQGLRVALDGDEDAIVERLEELERRA